MTVRGAAIAVLAVVLLVVGWLMGWPELTALGGGGALLVALCLVLSGPRPKGEVVLDHTSLRVVRGEAVFVRLRIDVRRRRRWMRIVDESGRTARPSRGPRDNAHIPNIAMVPLDTSVRGTHPIGPYALVHGDPWSVVRRVVHESDVGSVTVVPRTYPVGRRRLRTASVEDAMSASRRSGDQHFFALRDYVLGDEPRSIHWRSSARAGHLVVRQQVAAAKSGTTVVLDCDVTAYRDDDQFGLGWLSERFEAAVEVAASVVVADLGHNDRIHLARTTRQSTLISCTAASRGACLDVLAAVEPVPPVDTDIAGLPALVRRTRCSRVIVVTGTPHLALVDAVRRIRRSGVAVTLLRVGATGTVRLDGIDVIDVADAADLADQPG